MYQMNPLEAKSHGYVDFNFDLIVGNQFILYTHVHCHQ